MTHYLSIPVRRKSAFLVDDKSSSSILQHRHSRVSVSHDGDDHLTEEQVYLASYLRAFAAHSGEVIKLNVGGQLFETYVSTLQNVPNTRLSQLDKSSPYYNENTKSYFFDKNPVIFQCILDYYRDGDMHLPRDICPRQIQKDLWFWELNTSCISDCCRRFYEDSLDELAVQDFLIQELQSIPKQVYSLHSKVYIREDIQNWQIRAWEFLDDFGTSKAAKIWHLVYMFLIIVSIFTFFVSTLSVSRVPTKDSIYRIGTYWYNKTLTEEIAKDEIPKIQKLLTTSPHPVLQVIELFCLMFFTLEFIFRFAVCPWKLRLMKNFTTLIDLLYIIPAWTVIFVEITHGTFWHTKDGITFLIAIEAIEIFRVLRIFRFIKHHKGLRILYLVVKNSLSELSLLLVFVVFNITIFASFIYAAEAYSPELFENAFVGMWWALITMTTVGYGDFFPQSWIGYFVGSICALTGIIMIQMPIPIIVSNFHAYYGLRLPEDDEETDNDFYGQISEHGSRMEDEPHEPSLDIEPDNSDTHEPSENISPIEPTLNSTQPSNTTNIVIQGTDGEVVNGETL